jgi:Flp pilus assembly protein protease CpaA
MIRASVWQTIVTLWLATMHALVVWLILGCAVSGLVYLIVVTLLRRFWLRPSVVD